MIEVASLHFYPIKSCRGFAVERALVTRRGLEHDRLLMVVDEQGTFVTQRELPRMALIEPHLLPSEDGEHLTLRAPQMTPLDLTITQAGPRRRVTVWRSRCQAIDQGDVAADWLSTFLGAGVRLVRIADDFRRTVSPDYAINPDDETGFADGYPILLIGQASLDDLNRRLATPLPMNRFRPNIVVSGCESFAEDGWRRIRITGIEFALVKPCARCQITTTDQETAVVGKEPLTTLAAFRRVRGKVMFGQNLIGLGTGRVSVGDTVEVLS
jgi:uncharacterized protein YcbX